MHVREFVRVVGRRVERLALAYHYQDRAGSLRFRYDDARHHGTPTAGVHKHVGKDRVPTEDVTLLQVLAEIVGRHLTP